MVSLLKTFLGMDISFVQVCTSALGENVASKCTITNIGYRFLATTSVRSSRYSTCRNTIQPARSQFSDGSLSEGSLWKLAVTRTPDPIRPTRLGPDTNRPTRLGPDSWR